MTTNAFDFNLDDLESQAEIESGGGGATIICEALVEWGYKVYTSNQNENFFPAPIGNQHQELQDAALGKANTYAEQHGLDPKDLRFGIQITMFREGAMKDGVPVTWRANLYENYAYWTWKNSDKPSMMKKYVVPSLTKNQIGHGWRGWAQMASAPDPYAVSLGDGGKTDQDLEGNPRHPFKRYIAKTFPNKQAAMAAAATTTDTSSGAAAAAVNGPFVPDGWDAETYNAKLRPIFLQANLTGTLDQAVADYGMTDHLEAIRSSLSPV